MKKSLVILIVCLIQTNLSFLNAQSLEIEQPVRFLALGDSYTIGQSVAIQDRWPHQLYDSLAARGYQLDSLQIIAQTGWRTDNLSSAMNAAQLDSNYSLVSLLIGVNNQYQGGSASGYAQPFETLLQTAIKLAGGDTSHVFVLSIPDYAYTPFGGGSMTISADIDSFNYINKQISDQYKVKYFDITPISREGLNDPGLVASDRLHPSGKMYREWVRLILKDIPNLTTSLEEEVASASIYSFSTQESSYLRIKSRQAVRLSIWSMSGQLAIKGDFLPNQDIPVDLPKGLYLYELETREGKVLRGKLIF
jgi:lysophospholipase L1-like esterase